MLGCLRYSLMHTQAQALKNSAQKLTNRTLAVHERVDSRIWCWQIVNPSLLRLLSTNILVYYGLVLNWNMKSI